ncbi:unnamed protein product [Microthlaspi erraticum]|uniref:Protein POLAR LOCALIZATION DURING ASYMMETRIC DIVISION AND REDISTRIBUTION n=1 Tax=Microthlaspi erraticum TaxID=1685480 RepID=A0A6D2KFF5_9BRAS|nr:unnamed protein product [Microthlaspi erraticum]
MEGHGHSRRRRGDGCTVVECYTPRRVVSRWLSGLRSSKMKREAEDEQDDDSPISRPSDEKPKTQRYEPQSREAPLEMGIGSFLMYLVVASKTELDKMANLRMEMEMFLLNAKQELQKKVLQENPPVSSSSNNDAYAKEASDYQFSPQVISNLASSIFEGSSTSVLQEEVSKPEDYHGGTDHNPKLHAEVCSEKAGERQTEHQIQRQHKLKDNEGTKNHIPEMVKDERYGVCPYELEKKLHELRETRQQEELLKLEAALSRVERRLEEKETEASWWKDAARLLALRVPESSRAGLEWSITSSEEPVSSSFKACSKHRISFSR